MNTPEAQEALAFYRDIALVDHASPTITELQDPDKLSRFQSGRLAMMIEGNWFAPGFLKNDYLVENVASAVLPKEKLMQQLQMDLVGLPVRVQNTQKK